MAMNRRQYNGPGRYIQLLSCSSLFEIGVLASESWWEAWQPTLKVTRSL